MIEKKVTVATGASATAGFVLWALSAYVFKGEVPVEVITFTMWLVLTGSTFTGGYFAKHTPRPDLGES